MVQVFNQLTNLLNERLVNGLSTVSHNRYTLTVDGLLSPISILNVEGEEQLNQPWHYLIKFTSSDKALSIDAVLNQPASFTFNPASSNPLTAALSSLSAMTSQSQSRICYGVITAFNQLSVNKDEAHYSVVLSSRLALLSLNRNSTIFQNQSVVSVVEEVLRNHGFTGVDYRLMLKENYPAREFITQWQESDLEFIQRLLSDVGIWFRFESHAEHRCDVLVLSDYEHNYHNVGSIDYKLPTGTVKRFNSVKENLEFKKMNRNGDPILFDDPQTPDFKKLTKYNPYADYYCRTPILPDWVTVLDERGKQPKDDVVII